MKNKFNFTINKIRDIEIPTDKGTYYYDTGQPGLRLLVTPTGNKSFQFQMWSKQLHRPLTKTLGKIQSVSLAQARIHAAALVAELNDGKDIENDHRKLQRARLLEPTILDFTRIFIERHCVARQLRSTKETQRILDKEIIPAIGKLKVSDVKKADIIHLLDKIQDRGKLTMCNRTHALLSKLFNFAIERDVVEISPLYGLRKRGEEIRRERVLSNEEIKLLWESLGDSTTSLLIKFLLLTGQRTGETLEAEWSEINGALWHIPASKAKSKTAHIVPLSSGAMAIIEQMKLTSHNRYVFPGRPKRDTKQETCLGKDVPGHHFQRAIANFPWPRTTVHDLRRTMRSRLSELGVAPIVAEKAINHKTPGILGIYDRHEYMEEIKDALQRWSDHLQEIINGKNNHRPI